MINIQNPYRFAGGGGVRGNWGDISLSTDDGVSLDSSPQTGSNTSCVTTGDNESKIYMGTFGSDVVYQYSGSDINDLSTFSYDSKSFSFSSLESSLRDIRWSDAGDKVWIIGSGSNTVYELDAGTNWDVSSLVYNSVNWSVGVTSCYSLQFHTDGTQLFINSNGNIRAYDLSAPFDISSPTFSYTATIQSSGATVGMYINTNGFQILSNNITTTITSRTYATAWDFSTTPTTTETFTTTTVEAQLTSSYITENNLKMLITGRQTEDLNQLSLN